MSIFSATYLFGQIKGTISVKSTEAVDVAFESGADFYPGERVTVRVAGTVNINPSIAYREECTTFIGFKVSCDDVPYPINNYLTVDALNAAIIFKDKNDTQLDYKMINSQSYSFTIPHQYESFNNPVRILAFIPGQNIDRGTSIGSYSVEVSVDATTRASYFKNYIEYVLDNNLDVNLLKAGITRRLKNDCSVAFGRTVADYLGSSHFKNLSSEKKRKLNDFTKYIYNDVAPGNDVLQLKAADVYFQELDFIRADKELSALIARLESKEQDFQTLELRGNAFNKLAELYVSKNVGIVKRDLFKAVEYYHQAELAYSKAASFQALTEVLIKQADVLKAINTVQSLSRAKEKLEEAIAYNVSLYPTIKNELVGYRDLKNDIVISHQFDDALPFDPFTKLASAKKGSKWGVIDKKGKTVIDFKYGDRLVFTTSLIAPFEQDGKISFIDRSGRVVQKDLELDSVTHGYYRVRTSSEQFIPRLNLFVQPPIQMLPTEGHIIVGAMTNSVGLMDKQGHWIIPREYMAIYPISSGPGFYMRLSIGEHEFSLDENEEIGPELLKQEKNTLYIAQKPGEQRLFNASGQALCQSAGYIPLIVLSDNRDKIIVRKTEVAAGAMVNYVVEISAGKERILYQSPEYFDAFKDGVIIRRSPAGTLSCSRDWGTSFTELTYRNLFYNGSVYSASDESGKYALLDLNLQPLTPFEFENIDLGFNFRNQQDLTLMAVIKNNKHGFINLNGKIVIPASFDHANVICSGLYLVADATQSAYYNQSGIKLFSQSPQNRRYVEYSKRYNLVWLSGGRHDEPEVVNWESGSKVAFTGLSLPWVKTAGKWGMIGRDLNFLVEPTLDSVSYDMPDLLSTDNAYALVYEGGKTGIAVGGKIAINPVYDKLTPIMPGISIKEQRDSKNIDDLYLHAFSGKNWLRDAVWESTTKCAADWLFYGYSDPLIAEKDKQIGYMLPGNKKYLIKINE